MIKRWERKICFVVMEGVKQFLELSFLNLKITFRVIVSEFKNNFWRENYREQYDFTKSLEIFP